MRKKTFDIIGELVAGINAVFTASTIVDNGLFNYTLTSCNTLWINVGDVLSFGGNDYTVTAVDANVSITVQGTVELTVKTASVDNPFYRHGTIITTNTEIKKTNDEGDPITPLIFLREGGGFLRDRFFNADQTFDRESDLELYFLNQNDFSKTEADIIEFGTIPMTNLVNAFIETINRKKDLVGRPDEYTTEDWLRFGFQSSDGTKAKYFNVCDMTCVKLNVSLQFTRKLACCSN